jgi:GNAT superfamily N-acetyltransferase
MILIEFLSTEKIPPETHQAIDELDHLAFQSVGGPVGADTIKWASSQWMGLGWIQDQLVVQLGCLQRKIRVAGRPIRVAGIGGVATHPNFQRRGFARQLMAATAAYIQQDFQIPFGLLICDGLPCEFYQKIGWTIVGDHLLYQQEGRHLRLNTTVMALSLIDSSFPVGEIDLCGVPW